MTAESSAATIRKMKENDEKKQSGPRRAFCLTMRMEADSRNDLVSALMNFAANIDCEEVTVGAIGGPNSGVTYELLIDAEQTHDAYFEQLHQYLKKR